MQFQLPEGMSTTTTPQAGREAKRRSTAASSTEANVDNVKLTLKNSQDIRMLRAAVGYTFRFETESQWISVFRAATQRYNEAAEKYREQGKSAEEVKQIMGIPAVHGFNAWVMHYTESLKEKSPDQMAKAQVAIGKWAAAGWQHIHEHIPVCKRENMHTSKYTRMYITAPLAVGKAQASSDMENWTPTDFFIEMRNTWNAPGSKITQMRGEAPRGDLERKLQSWVDDK